MIHRINKPDAIIFIHDLNDISIYIKRHFICKNIFNFSFFIFKDNLCRLIYNFYTSAERCQRHIHITTVKQYQIGISHHLHKKRFHIIHINLECTCIHSHDLLHNTPALRQLHFFQFAHLPHAIVFHNHTTRMIERIISYKTLQSQFFRTVQNLYRSIAFFQSLFVQFYFPFFTKNQKSRLINLKIILIQRKIQK